MQKLYTIYLVKQKILRKNRGKYVVFKNVNGVRKPIYYRNKKTAQNNKNYVLGEFTVVIKFSLKQEKQIIKKYLNGNSSGQLGKQFNCSDRTICNILKRNKIKLKDQGAQFKYKVNENFFENIDTEENRIF